jgi:hypothetical protein
MDIEVYEKNIDEFVIRVYSNFELNVRKTLKLSPMDESDAHFESKEPQLKIICNSTTGPGRKMEFMPEMVGGGLMRIILEK